MHMFLLHVQTLYKSCQGQKKSKVKTVVNRCSLLLWLIHPLTQFHLWLWAPDRSTLQSFSCAVWTVSLQEGMLGQNSAGRYLVLGLSLVSGPSLSLSCNLHRLLQLP